MKTSISKTNNEKAQRSAITNKLNRLFINAFYGFKTRINIRLILGLFLIFAFISCRKKVDEINPDFSGEWESASNGIDLADYQLSIDENSKAIFKQHPFMSSDKTYKGYARIGNGFLTIGGIHKYKIIENPTRKDTSFTSGLFGGKENYKWYLILQMPSFLSGHFNLTMYKE